MYCINCGCNTHTQSKCYHPNISMGVITYLEHLDRETEFLMVKRKDTYGYVDLIRGKYPINDIDYIKMLFEIMTVSEKESIRETPFCDLWYGLWRNIQDVKYKTEYHKSHEKFVSLVNGIHSKDGTLYTLNSIIDNTTTEWIEEEWGFPKGKRNSNERGIQCAIREFVEETGYDDYHLNIVTNILPFTETFIGSNGKMYKNLYYIGNYTGSDIDILDRFQKSEISDMKWVPESNIKDILRPYDNRKLDIIMKISAMLKGNRKIIPYI